MPTQDESRVEQAADQVTGAHTLLKVLQEEIGEHPELRQAINKLEMALAILGVQTGGML
jgi:predicted double-glycine peptidase